MPRTGRAPTAGGRPAIIRPRASRSSLATTGGADPGRVSRASGTPVGHRSAAPTPSISDDLGFREPHVGRPEPGRLVEMVLPHGFHAGQVGDRPCDPKQAFGAAPAGPLEIRELDQALLPGPAQAARAPQRAPGEPAIEHSRWPGERHGPGRRDP